MCRAHAGPAGPRWGNGKVDGTGARGDGDECRRRERGCGCRRGLAPRRVKGRGTACGWLPPRAPRRRRGARSRGRRSRGVFGLASPVSRGRLAGSTRGRRCPSGGATPLRRASRGGGPTSAPWPSSWGGPQGSTRSTTAGAQTRTAARQGGAAPRLSPPGGRAGASANKVPRRDDSRHRRGGSSADRTCARNPQDGSTIRRRRSARRARVGAARVTAAHTSGGDHRCAFCSHAGCGRPRRACSGAVGRAIDARAMSRRHLWKGAAHRCGYCHAVRSGSHTRSAASPVSTGSAKSMTDSTTPWNCVGRSSRA